MIEGKIVFTLKEDRKIVLARLRRENPDSEIVENTPLDAFV